MTEQTTQQNETTPSSTLTPEQAAAQQALKERTLAFLDTLESESDAVYAYSLLAQQFGFIGVVLSQSDVSLALWERDVPTHLNDSLTHMILDDEKLRGIVQDQMTDLGYEALGSEVTGYITAIEDEETVMVVRTDAGDMEVRGQEDIEDAMALATASAGLAVQEMVEMAEADEEELELTNPDNVPLDATITAVFAKLRVSGGAKLLPLT